MAKTVTKPTVKGGTPAPKGKGPAKKGLREQFLSIADQCDMETVNAAYNKAEAGYGGGPVLPDDGYVWEIIEGSTVDSFEIKPKNRKGQKNEFAGKLCPAYKLRMRVVAADSSDEAVGKEFDFTFWMRPTRDKAGEVVIYDAARIKAMYEDAFEGEAPDDCGEAFIKLAEEGIGSQWNGRVSTKDGNTNMNINGIIAGDSGDETDE